MVKKIIFSTALMGLTSAAFAAGWFSGHPVIQVGGYISSQGQAQNISMQNIINNRYTVTDANDVNWVFGLGYFFDGFQDKLFNIYYGADAFYFSQTQVKGSILQQSGPRLSYHYDVINLPIYAALKVDLRTDPSYYVTLDAGMGPNFIQTSGFGQSSGIDSFSGNTTMALSAMAGIGVKFNRVIGSLPLECSYRYFYLGQGNLSKNASQVLDQLQTGESSANALICSVTF